MKAATYKRKITRWIVKGPKPYVASALKIPGKDLRRMEFTGEVEIEFDEAAGCLIIRQGKPKS